MTIKNVEERLKGLMGSKCHKIEDRVEVIETKLIGVQEEFRENIKSIEDLKKKITDHKTDGNYRN